MRWIDTKFGRHKGRFLFQCTLAGLSMFLILALMTSYSNAAVMAALGSSCFLVFALPHQPTSQPRLLIGGYVVGIAVGTLCFWVHRALPLPEEVGIITNFPHVLFGAISVALAIFVMVVTNTEHPPRRRGCARVRDSGGMALDHPHRRPDRRPGPLPRQNTAPPHASRPPLALDPEEVLCGSPGL